MAVPYHQSHEKALFGGELPWSPLDWTASDDRVRGGSSQSYLDIVPGLPYAVFRGTLDTKTLGGAGFASQRTTGDDRHWDLSAYDGIEIDVIKSDSKRYTFTVKDTLLPPSSDGREQSTVSWEKDFVVNCTKELGGAKIFVAWSDLTATYRGREQPDAKPLDLKNIERFSLMMRSFFDQQSGDFRLVVRSIKAVKKHEKRYRDDPDARVSTETDEKVLNGKEKQKQGWVDWVFGGCGIF